MKIKMIALSIVAMFSMGQTWPTFLGNPVIDQAEVLSPEAEQVLYEKILKLETETSNEMAVVTVKSLEGYDIKDYSNRLFRHYGIGTKSNNNGVLLLIAPNDRKVRIEVGYGLEPILTDGQSSDIINYIILPAFKSGELEKGVLVGTDEIINVISKTVAKFAIENPNTNNNNQDLAFGIFLVLYVTIGIGSIFIISYTILKQNRLRDLNRKDRYSEPRWVSNNTTTTTEYKVYPERSISSTSKHNKPTPPKRRTSDSDFGSGYAAGASSYSSSNDSSSRSSSSSSDFGSSSSSSDFGGGSSGGGGSDGSW